MTTGATGRHRAAIRPSTPLSALSVAVGDQVGSLGRGGVVIAMSSGLVATMGLPAQAVSGAHSEAAAKVTSALAGSVSPAVAAPSALLALPAALTGGAPVSAPAAAKVSFERPAFAAVPKPVARPSAPSRGSSGTFTIASFGSASGSSVIALAQRYLGVPYVFGGSSPGGWDCSGANVYIFGLLGISLPRTSNDQLNSTSRIPRSQARAGDLVFFLSGGRAYHTGIYDGSGGVYDSGRSGEVYQHRSIWSSNVVFTRVTG